MQAIEAKQARVPAPETGSLAKGLAALGCLADADGGLRLSEVAGRLSMARASARRVLHQLVALGYARQEGRLFHATERVTALALGRLGDDNPWSLAQPHLCALAERLGESVSIGVLDGAHVRYVARADVTRVLSVNLSVGSRLPACHTSMGRVLLAAEPEATVRSIVGEGLPAHTAHSIDDVGTLLERLSQVRAERHAIVDQELEPGLRSAAVPIERDGRTVAALNVGTSAARHSVETLRERFVPALADTADRIGSELRSRRTRSGDPDRQEGVSPAS